MSSKYCQFCGLPVEKLTISRGIYCEHTCSNEGCPAHEREPMGEYPERLDGFIYPDDGDDEEACYDMPFWEEEE